MSDEFEVIDIREFDTVSGDEFKRWVEETIGSRFGDGFKFWTSSRGDHWEQIEAKSAEDAAVIQAERWSELGYRGPFTIMVSQSGLPAPPKSGDRVWIFDVKPEVTMKATKLDYKFLG